MPLTPSESAILERISNKIAEKGMTQKELCKAIGVGAQAFTNWKSGNNTSFMKKLPQIAETLQVPLDYILRGKVEHPVYSNEFGQVIPYEKRGSRPIVGDVSAGTGIIAAQDILGWENVDDNYDNDECFWLRVSGDSMSPKIDSGDLILIDKSAQIESGNIVVALVENEGFIKRAELTPDSITLVSFNPYYPPMIFVGKDAERVYFVGKVVKQERDL